LYRGNFNFKDRRVVMEGYFEVDVHGEYFAQVKDKKELRAYSATFKIPDASKPLSVIKGKLLSPYLQKQDPAYSSAYTYVVDEIRCKGRRLGADEIPPRFQNKEQLKEYIKFHQLPVNVDDYEDVGRLREHVRLAKEEPKVFPAIQKKFLERMEEENKLFSLNADILKPTVKAKIEETSETEVEEPKVTQKKPAPRPKVVKPITTGEDLL
jgi:hypothetical protein